MRDVRGARTDVPLAFVSNLLEPPDDEGTRRVASTLAGYASSAGFPVITISRNDPIYVRKLLLSARLMAAIRTSQAKAAIYLPQSASTGSFLRAAVLRAGAKLHVMMIALQPVPRGALGFLVARAFGPDLVLTPSTSLMSQIHGLGLPASFLPMGVDLERFRPVDGSMKRLLRKKCGLPEEGPVVLHVGHLQPLRNLGWVVRVHETMRAMTVVVGGTTMGVDPQVSTSLQSAGLHVINHYLERIEEIYQLADCYVFPVMDERAAIGIPLSVLEGMACNLPVVTTPFGGLPRIFSEGDGLFYADNDGDFVRAVQQALTLRPEAVRTREKVLSYSWANIFEMVVGKAQQLALE